MRISNARAEELAKHISSSFMVSAMTKAKATRNAVVLEVFRTFADKTEIDWLDAVPEFATKLLRSCDWSYRISAENNRFNYTREDLGIRSWPAYMRAVSNVELVRATPHIKLYDRYVKAVAALNEAENNTNKLYRELLANIKGAGTVKKLLAAWPEQRGAIEEFFGTAEAGTCQTPLTAILEKYQNLAPEGETT